MLLASFSGSYAMKNKVIAKNNGLMKSVINYAAALIWKSTKEAEKKRRQQEMLRNVAKTVSQSCTIL